jgi:Flp pilus assembly pilin Flp
MLRPSQELDMRSLVTRFLVDDQGLETVEWAIMAALIVSGIVAAVLLLAPKVAARLDAMEKAVP